MMRIITPLSTVLNCPTWKDPMRNDEAFFPSKQPSHMVRKLPNAAVMEIAAGESPIRPALNPLVSAFADTATPRTMDSNIPISPEPSASAVSGFCNRPAKRPFFLDDTSARAEFSFFSAQPAG